MFQDLTGKLRYLAGLKGYLRGTITPDQARDLVRRGADQQEDAFLKLVERGVYQNLRSPYRRLLLHAGVDVRRSASDRAPACLASTLTALHDAGVYVTYPEMRGIEPIKRPGLELWSRTRCSSAANEKVLAEGVTVTALVYTTLLTNSRKILINAESGDAARIVEPVRLRA